MQEKSWKESSPSLALWKTLIVNCPRFSETPFSSPELMNGDLCNNLFRSAKGFLTKIRRSRRIPCCSCSEGKCPQNPIFEQFFPLFGRLFLTKKHPSPNYPQACMECQVLLGACQISSCGCPLWFLPIQTLKGR